jgi:hypothetical protein
MVKKLVTVFIALVSVSLISYGIYKLYAPTIIANELLKETEPTFLPKKIAEKIKKVKTETNQLSTDIIKDIHKSNISLDQLLNGLDEVTEDEANSFLDEINNLEELESPDQIFDLAKNHFPVDFDVEPLREPFRNKADIHKIETLIQKANEYRDNNLINFESAKAIIKRILIEKEKELKPYTE